MAQPYRVTYLVNDHVAGDIWRAERWHLRSSNTDNAFPILVEGPGE